MQDVARIQRASRRRRRVTNKRHSVILCDNDPTIERGTIIRAQDITCDPQLTLTVQTCCAAAVTTSLFLTEIFFFWLF